MVKTTPFAVAAAATIGLVGLLTGLLGVGAVLAGIAVKAALRGRD